MNTTPLGRYDRWIIAKELEKALRAAGHAAYRVSYLRVDVGRYEINLTENGAVVEGLPDHLAAPALRAVEARRREVAELRLWMSMAAQGLFDDEDTTSPS